MGYKPQMQERVYIEDFSFPDFNMIRIVGSSDYMHKLEEHVRASKVGRLSAAPDMGMILTFDPRYKRSDIKKWLRTLDVYDPIYDQSVTRAMVDVSDAVENLWRTITRPLFRWLIGKKR